MMAKTSRPQRAARVLGEGQRRGGGEDPKFDSDDDVEVFFNLDVFEQKWPGKPKSRGDGLYDVYHVKPNGEMDGDVTLG